MKQIFLLAVAVLASINAASGSVCINNDSEAIKFLSSHPLDARQENETHHVDVYFHIASTQEHRDMISEDTVDKQVSISI